MFYPLILCLSFTLSSWADEEGDGKTILEQINDLIENKEILLDEDGFAVTDCYRVPPEVMVKHVYVHGDNSEAIQLHCPVEKNEFIWRARYYESFKDNEYYYVHDFREDKNKYSASGDTRENSALNIGKPDKKSSGVYCCWPRYIFSDGVVFDKVFVKVSHAVLILSKVPEIKLLHSNRNLVKIGDVINLQCSEPPYKNIAESPKPTFFWENKNFVGNNVTERTLKLKATLEYHNTSFRCGWKYENLANNGGSRMIFSKSIILEVKFAFIDEELSTDNSFERIKVGEGKSTTLTCAFKANPPVNTTDLVWTKMSFPVEDNYPKEISIHENREAEKKFIVKLKEDSLTTLFSLTINNFSKIDIGSYRCKLSDQLEREFKVTEQIETTTTTKGPDRSLSNGQLISFGLVFFSSLHQTYFLP